MSAFSTPARNDMGSREHFLLMTRRFLIYHFENIKIFSCLDRYEMLWLPVEQGTALPSRTHFPPPAASPAPPSIFKVAKMLKNHLRENNAIRLYAIFFTETFVRPRFEGMWQYRSENDSLNIIIVQGFVMPATRSAVNAKLVALGAADAANLHRPQQAVTACR